MQHLNRVGIILLGLLVLALSASAATGNCPLPSGEDSITRSVTADELIVNVTGVVGFVAVDAWDSQNRSLGDCMVSGETVACPLFSTKPTESSFKIKVRCTAGSSTYFVTRHAPSALESVNAPDAPWWSALLVALAAVGLIFFKRK